MTAVIVAATAVTAIMTVGAAIMIVTVITTVIAIISQTVDVTMIALVVKILASITVMTLVLGQKSVSLTANARSHVKETTKALMPLASV